MKLRLTVPLHPLLLICLLALYHSPVFALHAAHDSQSLTALDLQHEPIQPLPEHHVSEPAKVSLGERLFHDKRLGKDNDMSCASCHVLDDNGADRQDLAPGRDGKLLDVNTLTVFNSALNHQQFWDGRAVTLEEQINFVVLSDREFATSWPVIIAKLKQDSAYRQHFEKIYAEGITADNVRDAIAAFERTLLTLNSPFDRYLRGDAEAINSEEKEGYRLFKAYGCVACHQGSNVGGNLFMKIGIFGDYFGLRGNPTKADLGRFNVPGDEADRHVFRVPSLRLAVLTPPYFHDGSVKNINDAIKIMARHQLGRIISQHDVNSIAAFLKTLPGQYRGQVLGGKSGSNQQVDVR